MNGGRVALAGGQQSAHGRSQWARTAFVSGQPRSAPRATGCALIRQFADSFTPFCRILLLEPCVPFKHKSVFGRCSIWHSSFLFYRNKYLTSCSTIFPKAVVFWREFLHVTYSLVYFRLQVFCVCVFRSHCTFSRPFVSGTQQIYSVWWM